jgi:hypothetical protein
MARPRNTLRAAAMSMWEKMIPVVASNMDELTFG